jgi:hypothetical protein
MDITKGVYQLSGFQAADLCHHHGEQRVRGDVEGDSQKHVGTALIELTGQLAAVHIKLEQHMAGRQFHFLNVGHVPGTDYETSGIRVVLNLLNHSGDLIDVCSTGKGPGTPLVTVNRTQFSLFIGPVVPDLYVVIPQVTDVRISGEKPKKFVNDRAQMNLLGSQQGEVRGQTEACLISEHAECSRSRAILFFHAIFKNVLKQIQILTHRFIRAHRHDRSLARTGSERL